MNGTTIHPIILVAGVSCVAKDKNVSHEDPGYSNRPIIHIICLINLHNHI